LDQIYLDALTLLVESGRCTKEELEELTEREAELVAIEVLNWVETQGQDSLVLKSIDDADRDFEVPDVIQLVEDPYYLGHDLWFPIDDVGKPLPGEEKQLYNYWLGKLEELYIKRPNYYHEILVTGAIGTGKTTFMNIVDIMDYTNILSLKEPQRYYGLMPTTDILFAFFNITKDLAQDVGFAQFNSMLNNSPFFKEHMTLNRRRKEGFQLESPKRIVFGIGSRFTHSLGQAVFNAQIDEANFGITTVEGKRDVQKSQVVDNYTNLLRRQESRFMRMGKIPGHFKIGSSKQTEADFLEEHIEKSKTRPNTMVIDVTQYEAKACRKELYSGMKFNVLLGDISRDPRLIEQGEEIDDALKGSIIDVPIEHKSAFEDNIVEALRDIAGKAARPRSAFILNQQAVRDCISKSNRPSPWKYNNRADQVPNTIHIDFYDDSDQIANYLIKEKVFWWNKGTQLPYPYRPRFLAIDTGYVEDAAGIAMCCKAGVRVEKRNDPETGKEKVYFIQQYYPDFYIRIKGVKEEEFPLYKLTEFVKFLKKEWAINIKAMSTDGHQSKQLRQDVKRVFPSMDVELQSVDKDDEAFVVMRNVFYTRAFVGLYHDQNMLVELFDLIHKRAKRTTQTKIIKMLVDHPVIASDKFKGRKDVCDALAGACNLCSKGDTGISREEVEESKKEFENVKWDELERKAAEDIEKVMADVDAMNLDDLFKDAGGKQVAGPQIGPTLPPEFRK
jgi:hypothetical protein